MTITSWLISAAVLLSGVVVCGLAAWRRPTFEGLVALELGGTLATVTLVCLTVGFQQSSYGDVPIMAAVLNAVGSLVYVRFLDRSRA
ncbi:MAG TPA: monovalent cation/H+ antiporter complex subunit F [Acidimicrobiales bacterium]|nr:monovalent cation/H+ antiporter complex subunit F [Acidimicrobiales bacterium]